MKQQRRDIKSIRNASSSSPNNKHRSCCLNLSHVSIVLLVATTLVVVTSVSVCFLATSLTKRGDARVVHYPHLSHSSSSSSGGSLRTRTEPREGVPDERRHHPSAPPVASLEGEARFALTLKSSNPTQKNQGVGGDRSRRRIAILSPPGAIGEVFSALLRKSVQSHYSSAASRHILKLGVQLEVVRTSHIPPYGYGKNHGFNKIVRLATLPLPLGVVDALMEVSEATGAETTPAESRHEVQAVLRQIVRWHCRVSHVSAHTPVLTVNVTDFVRTPDGTLATLLNFVFDTDKFDSVLGERVHVGSYELGKLRSAVDDAMDATRVQMDADATSRLGSALAEEMDSTNDLKAWPCQTLWVGGRSGEDGGSRSPSPTVLSSMAASLAPDCLDPMIKCTINKDLCEEAADLSLCQEQK